VLHLIFFAAVLTFKAIQGRWFYLIWKKACAIFY